MRSRVEIESKLQNYRSLLRTVDDYRDPDGASELRHWIRALEWVLGPQDKLKDPQICPSDIPGCDCVENYKEKRR